MVAPVGLSDLYPVLPILYAVGFFNLVFPLPPHILAGNAGVVILVSWFSIYMLTSFINAIVWRGTVEDLAPLYCDFVTAIQAVVVMGCECGVLCITRQLYKITRLESVCTTKAEVRNCCIYYSPMLMLRSGGKIELLTSVSVLGFL